MTTPFEPVRLSDFKLNESIGSGSTSKVFDAVHVSTGRPVALKVLEKEASSSAELRARLAREALILAGVESNYVGRIFGLGYDKDLPFLVLERLRGETLDALIKREGQPSTRQIVQWIEQILMGVRDCHAAGIVHRDIKPSNVFLSLEEDGTRTAKLIDFGVARLREVTQPGSTLTQTHHLIGSMGYMAPEQVQSAKGVGPQADLYAVGVVVFRVISGRLPFMHRSLEVVVRMKCESDAPLLSSMPNVISIRALDDFCARALAREPSNRFQNAREMLDEWWNVVTYIDADAPLTIDGAGMDVVFDDEQDALNATLLDPGSKNPSASPKPDRVAKSYGDSMIPISDSTHPRGSSENTATSPSNREIKKLLDSELELRRKERGS